MVKFAYGSSAVVNVEQYKKHECLLHAYYSDSYGNLWLGTWYSRGTSSFEKWGTGRLHTQHILCKFIYWTSCSTYGVVTYRLKLYLLLSTCEITGPCRRQLVGYLDKGKKKELKEERLWALKNWEESCVEWRKSIERVWWSRKRTHRAFWSLFIYGYMPFMPKTPNNQPIMPILQSLHWLPIKHRIHFRIATWFTFWPANLSLFHAHPWFNRCCIRSMDTDSSCSLDATALGFLLFATYSSVRSVNSLMSFRSKLNLRLVSTCVYPP